MTRFGFSFFFFIFFAGLSLGMPRFVLADSAANIQSQIEANNRQLESLKAEIAADQKKLDALGAKKNTLQSTVDSLTLSQKQLATQIQATQNKISSANLQIQKLSLSIGDKEVAIAADQSAITKALQSIAEGEQESIITRLISAHSFGEAWQVADESIQFNRALGNDINDLRAVRTELSVNRDEVTAVKTNLLSLQKDLSLQKKSVEVSKAAQQKLVAETKNQESTYQKLIAQKRTQQAEFEAQLFQYEAQLKQILNPSAIPTAHTGILVPPLVDFFVTQYFGKTVDAQRLYVSGTHGGIDLRARIGTPVKAALSGVVTDTESVKIKSGCQYGKWVLIKHTNGLSTIYGHLSFVNVKPGDTVATGQIIGLSGDTGFSTGPHLHFGVYASEGLRIVDSRALGSVNCVGIKTVAATPTAYLDPMLYL